MLRVLIHKSFGFEPKKVDMVDALKQRCLQTQFNPILDYLDGLRWDGTPRLETWLIDRAGAPDTPFVREVSKLCLVAAVRRARQPGCKFDEIIVLEGAEGKNKSSLIQLMAGEENFSDQSILNADERRQQEHLKGKWLYEIADLTGIRKADIETVKAFASRQVDRCRRAWDMFEFDQKRQCVLFATTNDHDYLQSQTGNRRWWPIAVTKTCDLKRLASERDQLWAEASHIEKSGASIRLPEELWPAAAEEQEKRRTQHPWEDILCNVRGRPQLVSPSSPARCAIGVDSQHEERIFSADIMQQYLRLDPAQQTSVAGKQVKQIMLRLGWEYHSTKVRIGDAVGKGYSRIVDGPLPEPPEEGKHLD